MSQLKSGELSLGGTVYRVVANYGALRRVARHLAPLRDKVAYSYWDAIAELWRSQGGGIFVNPDVLHVFVWACIHTETRAGALEWAGLDFDETGELIDAQVEAAESMQLGELSVFSVVLDALYNDKVLRRREETEANPTEAVETSAAQQQ